MIRGYLKDRIGDALHAISCAAGYHIGWLLRASLRLGLTGLFALVFLASALSARWSNRSTQNVRTLSPATALPSKSSLIAELNLQGRRNTKAMPGVR